MTARVDRPARLPSVALLGGLIGCLTVVSPAAALAEILVFTDRVHPVRSAEDARIIELDLPARIEAELAAGLPADAGQAAELAQQRLRDGGDGFQRRIEQAYQGVTDAWTLGVVKLPAVVVDRRYVVYGVADVRRAVVSIQATLGGRP